MTTTKARSDAMLGDTNILLRLGELNAPERPAIISALRKLAMTGRVLHFTMQNMAEVWNVCTRPRDRNGLGLSIDETENRVRDLENLAELLTDSPLQYDVWRDLVLQYNVRGKQVHDARLVAAMRAHGLSQILTLNGADFRRYDAITVVHPSEV